MTPIPVYPARPGGLRIVVTGGRDYPHLDSVAVALDHLHRARGIVRLAHGDARGVDKAAGAWAQAHGVTEPRYTVTDREWRELGKRAGVLRNTRMLEAEQPDLLVAFPGGRGTADCMRSARSRGITVWEPFAGCSA